jgi:outer membrane lipoprotein-sorting protein
MNKRRIIRLSVLVMLSLLLSPLVSGCQNRPSAEEIVARLREVEANTEDAHAILEISFRGQGMDEELVIEVWEKEPNKLRAVALEASNPEFVGIVSVTDGQQRWIYNPNENEVIVGDPGQDEPTSPREILRFADDMIQQVLDTSEVELVGEEDVAGVATYKLEFTPKEDAESILPVGSKATMWVDQERWVVLQAHFSGEIFGEGWVRVRSFELNTGIADDRFQFEIPEGTQVTSLEDVRPTPITLDEARQQADFALLVPAYLPEGATLINVFAVEGAFVLYYDHAATSFTVMQGSSETTEELPIGQATEVTVRDQAGTLVTDGLGNSFLTWTEDGVAVTIAGRIGQDEILKVAESLE